MKPGDTVIRDLLSNLEMVSWVKTNTQVANYPQVGLPVSHAIWDQVRAPVMDQVGDELADKVDAQLST